MEEDSRIIKSKGVSSHLLNEDTKLLIGNSVSVETRPLIYCSNELAQAGKL